MKKAQHQKQKPQVLQDSSLRVDVEEHNTSACVFENGNWVEKQALSFKIPHSTIMTPRKLKLSNAHHILDDGNWVKEQDASTNVIDTSPETLLSHHIFGSGEPLHHILLLLYMQGRWMLITNISGLTIHAL